MKTIKLNPAQIITVTIISILGILLIVNAIINPNPFVL